MYWKIEDRIAETAAYIAKQEAATRISRTAVETLSRDVDAIWDACEEIIEEAERVNARYHLSVAERLHSEATELAKRLGALHQKRCAA
jgi:predicted nucleic acid-binding protein